MTELPANPELTNAEVKEEAEKAMEEAQAKLEYAEEFSPTYQMFLYLQNEVERKGVESCRQTYNAWIQTYNELIKKMPDSRAQLTSLRVASTPPWITIIRAQALFLFIICRVETLRKYFDKYIVRFVPLVVGTWIAG